MSKQSCAEAIVRALEAENVKHVFIGPPGEHVVELYDALLGSKRIEGILATNEYTLSFMADGYSRATGAVGVFTVVPGPGVTNALTGIAEAFTDSSPLVGIISDVRSMIEEDFQLHQIPNLDVLAPVTKKTFRITDPNQVFETVAVAFQTARSGEPGPVMIEVPCDLYPLPCDNTALQRQDASIEVPKGIHDLATLIRRSKQIGLYIGRGCAPYADEVRRLAEHLQAPVASSVSGRGILPDDHPLSVGFGFGSNGSKIARQVFDDCDTVLAIGCKFGEVSTGSYSFKIPPTFIHVDINPANLNKVFKTEHTLVCDAGVFIRGLLHDLADYNINPNEELQSHIQRAKAEFTETLATAAPNAEHVDPGKFYVALRQYMAPDDTLTVDIGNHELWAISCFSVLKPATFLCPTNFSAMGFAISAAIATQIAKPETRAVCCVGDGGFLMSGFEILTAVRHKLPVAFFVFNDGALGITKGLQQRLFRRPAFVDLKNPDFEQLAASFGVAFHRIENDHDIKPVLDAVWAVKQPVLIEVCVTYDKMSPFLKGIVRHRMKVTPWQEKLHYARRFLRRTVIPWVES